MLHSRGEYILMVDADGATEFTEFDKILQSAKDKKTKDGHSIAIGSRNHMVTDEVIMQVRMSLT